MITVGSVLAILAVVSGLILGIDNAANSGATVSVQSQAMTSFLQDTFYLSFLVAAAFYILGILFLWQGFAARAVVQLPVQTQVLAICPSCKSRVSAESKFCSVCGASLGK